MKLSLILATASLLLLCHCRTASPSDHVVKKEEPEEPSAEKPAISVGMTKSQVMKAWGEPSGRQVTGHGEIWTWGGQRWKRVIPYAGPFMHVQTSKVVFGADGRVKDFRLTDHGDVMTDMEGYSGGHMPW